MRALWFTRSRWNDYCGYTRLRAPVTFRVLRMSCLAHGLAARLPEAIIIIILSLAVTHPLSRQNWEKHGVVIRGTQSEMTEDESVLRISVATYVFFFTHARSPLYSCKPRGHARRDKIADQTTIVFANELRFNRIFCSIRRNIAVDDGNNEFRRN